MFSDVCKTLIARKVISEEVGKSLRHPRMFSVYILSRNIEKGVTDMLNDRREAFQTFLAAVGKPNVEDNDSSNLASNERIF